MYIQIFNAWGILIWSKSAPNKDLVWLTLVFATIVYYKHTFYSLLACMTSRLIKTSVHCVLMFVGMPLTCEVYIRSWYLKSPMCGFTLILILMMQSADKLSSCMTAQLFWHLGNCKQIRSWFFTKKHIFRGFVLHVPNYEFISCEKYP